MRPNIPGHEVEHSQVTTLSQLAYDPTMEVRRETLHGHAAALPMELVGADHIDLVMLSAGGCIYDDDQWALAVLKAARQLAGPAPASTRRSSGRSTTPSARPRVAR